MEWQRHSPTQSTKIHGVHHIAHLDGKTLRFICTVLEVVDLIGPEADTCDSAATQIFPVEFVVTFRSGLS